MTTLDITTAPRVFKVGSIRLPDPDPSRSPTEAVQLYAGSYPHVVDATLEGPTINAAAECEYLVVRNAVKTKG